MSASYNSNEDRLKKLLRNTATQAQQAPAYAPSPVEVNMGGHISPVANIKVVGVGGG